MSKNRAVYGFHAVNALMSSSPDTIEKLCVQSGREDERLEALLEKAETQGLVVEVLARHALDRLIGGEGSHQGVVALSRAMVQPTEASLKDLILTLEHPALLLILDGVQDPHNLGACLRSANAFGVDAVIGPKRRAATLTPVARKVASGAAESTPYIAVTNLARTLAWLKDQGVWLVGLSESTESPLSAVDLTGPIGLVMGGESGGLRRLTREYCDYMAQIPMCGDVDSLNVSAASAITLYEAQRQRSG